MISLGFITIAVIGWQVLILISSITCALIWGKKGASYKGDPPLIDNSV